MEKYQKDFIETYQCPGCVCGGDVSCFEASSDGIQCEKHVAGTNVMPCIGKIFLGMPKGFNRVGPVADMAIFGFKYFDDGWLNKFNVAVWKYLDEHGNTVIRGLSPRVNWPFLHIFLGDQRDKIDCLEITQSDLDEMD